MNNQEPKQSAFALVLRALAFFLFNMLLSLSLSLFLCSVTIAQNFNKIVLRSPSLFFPQTCFPVTQTGSSRLQIINTCIQAHTKKKELSYITALRLSLVIAFNTRSNKQNLPISSKTHTQPTKY
ncbi:hypothetical protein EDD21DRAFT_372587 [Dissophora ornata]|nr:hypothetical protein EDD21DRAFT_372587 [Dissophora ornata]